ncbi:MAG: Hemolysin-type calcium-binding region [Labilithrix sp.]|nr:Hemolysin-type calcium-binding region [Labilithrix sp.]
MYRAFRWVSAATIVTCLVMGAGCAMSSPADLTPDVDPNLPGIDAGNDPRPAPGSTSGGTAAKPDAATESDDPSGQTGTDSGTKPTIAPDASTSTPDASSTGATAKPAAGEILVSEVMYDSTGAEPASEWIEIYSKAAAVRSLSGLTLKDGGNRTHVIGAGVTIAPGAYIVLARNKAGAITAKVPAAAIAYEYGTGLADSAGVLLANGATGGITLLDGSTTVASAPYGGWFTQAGGSSAQLHVLDASTATSKASWCLSSKSWTTGSEKGTPGAADDCP